MKWMKPEFDNTFSQGKGGFTWCWHNIRRGGYLIMMLDYKEGGGQESGKKWLHNKWMLPNYVLDKLLSN